MLLFQFSGLYSYANIQTIFEKTKYLKEKYMGRPRKFDYDSDDFYDEILALAMQGLTDAEIADALEDKFGESLSPEVFCTMINGNYDKWSDEENQQRSARLAKVLARGRRKILSVVRGAYLKAALGGKKIKSKTTVTRKMRINGEYTDDEEIQTSETEQELPYNVQALSTFLYHHDPTWRKIERKQDEESSDIPINIRKGVDIDNWIKEQVGEND